ncbi:sodium:proton antiporter [Actinomyces sp. oral taxon 414]|uniref:cation:proton antiporter n=1 Tax=Actinomyces sp. oral taxon 414 TaxID=712122 RepID=UPI0006ADEA49|nr:cation:proton antiporter [Actinomyces sp. oral taxon 414]ALC98317.1 sodium:proton antiporter [Actinomyces sp. oral taxon 414]
MAHAFVSLLCIVAVALLAPLLSWGVPRRMLPETVLLILGGVVIGPDVLGIAHIGRDIGFLRELGIAFLFLMAGYEIDVNELRGTGGRHAMIAWIGSLALAFATVAAVGVTGGPLSANGIAIAIAMTSTAIGTILPILRERDLLPTAVGVAILNHGAVGEVGPIILMALLLGTRSTWQSLVILLAFLTISLLIVRFTDRVQRAGRRLVEAIHLGGSTTAQTTIRVTILLLVGLCTLAEVFELDVVLGAFAAGFILRYAVPDGDRQLEEKLDGLAYGFFVPLFFVTSGMAIELDLTASSLIYLGAFLVLLVLTRGLPVWVSALLERRRDGSRAYSVRQSLQIAVYSTTALPIIVAVTQVAVDAGAMRASFASTLVLAGALSVLVMPALGLALSSDADREPTAPALAAARGPAEASGGRAENAARAGAAGAGAAPVPAAQAQDGSRRRRRHDLGMHQYGLTASEARYLAERLAQIEADRAHWRAQMRQQMHLDREEAEQRRAVLRAQNRAHLREERAQLRELRRETARVYEEARRRRDAGEPRE